tara:strand:+ start:5009 stop:6139 length:1131 start_codon:yes stop_codon:yes gene_type:complete
MKRLRVMTVVGTRPEIIRLSQVMKRLDETCDHTIVHTGQNYDFELNEIFFEDLEIRKPDYFLECAADSAIKTMGLVLAKMDDLLNDNPQDAVLVLGDTNSCISLLAAKRKRIPTFHMEAGNRCFDMRVPEEINRKLVDHVADVNLPYSSIARDYLLSEGLPKDLIIKTGSPMKEVLNKNSEKIKNSDILDKYGLEKDNFFLISAHREENIDSEKNFSNFLEVLDGLIERFQLPIVVSTHPRTKKRIDSLNKKFDTRINFSKPMSFSDYNNLQLNAKVTLSDSGTISEESSILNFPALNIREAHERPEAMEEASVIMTGMNIERIFQSISILDGQVRGSERNLSEVLDYKSENVSEKICRIIHSYTDYVNRVIWKKY